MYQLGVLFGLGFDTAMEVMLLGLSAYQAANGLPLCIILFLPALFTAGMNLIDTLDGMVMLGAYSWAYVNPLRKLYYNLVIMSISIAIALAVGLLEILSILEERFAISKSQSGG